MSSIVIRLFCLFVVTLAINNEPGTTPASEKPVFQTDPVHGRCLLVIGEAFLTIENDGNWVEIMKICQDIRHRSTAVEDARTLNGFFLVTISAQKSFVVDDMLDLSGKLLVTATTPGPTQPKVQALSSCANTPIPAQTVPSEPSIVRLQSFKRKNSALSPQQPPPVINSPSPPSPATESVKPQLVHVSQLSTGLKDENDVKLVVLLYYSFKDLLAKKHEPSTFVKGAVVTGDIMDSIISNAIDLLVIGKKWPEDLHPGVTSIVESFPSLVDRDFVLFPWKGNINQQCPRTLKSISRCGTVYSGFAPHVYKYTEPTKNAVNSCQDTEDFIVYSPWLTHFPFSFKGATIPVAAQKFIINLNYALGSLDLKKEILEANPAKLTAILLNLNKATVLRYTRHYQQKLPLETPGQHREYTGKCQRLFEDPDVKEMLKKSITEFYAKNQVPTIDDIFKLFMEKVRSKQLEEAAQLPPNPDLDINDLPMLFSCHFETFRKILYKEGYKFGRVDQRAVIVLEPRIVRWRGIYLHRRKLLAANPTIYLDETWYDVHQRSGRGWVPKQNMTYAEMSQFSFAQHKASRGPRLIMIAAGGRGGMVRGSPHVFGLTDNIYEDYHRNINADVFTQWFKKLLDLLGNEPHNIVMDNASYHSVSTLPKSNFNKQPLYDGLQALQSKYPDIIKLKPFKEITVKELKEILKQVKLEDQSYKIDEEAESRGHKVLRLPPYNCELNPIEMVWSKVKRELRKHNAEQTLDASKRRAEILLNGFSTEEWQNYCDHAEKLEEKYRTEDNFINDFLDENPNMEIIEDENVEEDQ